MAKHANSISASIADIYRPTLVRMRRRALEGWIEEAISLLDLMDADPEAEDDGSAEYTIQPLALRGGADVLAA